MGERSRASTHGIETLRDALCGAETTEDRLVALLSVARERLGADEAYVTRIDTIDAETIQTVVAAEGAVRLDIGQAWSLDGAPCQQAIEAGELTVTEEVVVDAIEYAGYLGIPITHDETVAGTCWFGADSLIEAPERDTCTMIDLVHRIIELEMERSQLGTSYHIQSDRLERLASTASHDLRTPLTVATGRLALAKPDADAEHFDAIERALTRLEGLIDGLVRSVRDIDPPRELRPVSLDAFDTADVTVVDADQIRTDPVAFAELLECLRADGGRDALLEVGVTDNGLYVHRTGPPIPEDARHAALEWGRPETAHHPTLPLAVQLCECLGWEIAVTESDDAGTRFELSGVDHLTGEREGSSGRR